MRQHRLDDRRIVECALTDTGRGLIAAIAGMRRDTMRRTLGVLTDEELGRLTGLIKTILERSKSRAK
jgi:DNA-binding MarR family transcriptional regulator